MKNNLWILSILFCIFVGCSSEYHILNIETTPSGANILFDGKSQSDTPCVIKIPYDGQSHYIFITKNGYEKVRKILQDNMYPSDFNIVLTPNSK